MKFKFYEDVLMIATDQDRGLDLGPAGYNAFNLSGFGKEFVKTRYQEVPKDLEPIVRPIIDNLINNNPYSNYCYYKPAEKKQVDLLLNLFKEFYEI